MHVNLTKLTVDMPLGLQLIRVGDPDITQEVAPCPSQSADATYNWPVPMSHLSCWVSFPACGTVRSVGTAVWESISMLLTVWGSRCACTILCPSREDAAVALALGCFE